MSNLWHLELDNNFLTGPVPPELTSMSNLWELSLSGNSLTGPIPPELGSMSSLHWLDVAETSLAGPLPEELVGLDLVGFVWHDTGLCAPDDPVFLSWLRSIETVRSGEICTAGG